jgi:hypothetical protein
MKRYRLTEKRRRALEKIAVNLWYAFVVAAGIIGLGLLNGLVERIP